MELHETIGDVLGEAARDALDEMPEDADPNDVRERVLSELHLDLESAVNAVLAVELAERGRMVEAIQCQEARERF